MNRQDKYKLKILKLNEAWKLIRKGLTLIREAFPKDNDVNYFWWKLNKANDKMQTVIYKKLESLYINDEWEKMVKRLKEKE